MNTTSHNSVQSAVTPWLRRLVAATFALILVACGGGGWVSVPPPESALFVKEPRALSAEFLARRAVAYSPYRTNNRDTETPSVNNIKQDMQLLLMADLRLIRLFDSSDKVAKQTLQVIKDNGYDIKVMLGSYVQSDKYAEAAKKPEIAAYNKAELARTVKLANDFKDIVLAVSVGNETMVSWSYNPIEPADMATYIKTVRSQITQPITTDDNWAVYATPSKLITDVIDFATMHTYPELDSIYTSTLWDWKQAGVSTALNSDGVPARAAAMMNAAITRAKFEYQSVRDALDRKGLSAMPVVIGETGWNAVDVGDLKFRAHPVNQKIYLQALEAWGAAGRTGTGPAKIVYFEAFDEPWKGNDDKWGLFDVDRKARFVIQRLNADGATNTAGTATWTYASGSYTLADATYYTPLVKNTKVTAAKYVAFSTPLTGDVFDASSSLSFNAAFGATTRGDPSDPVLNGQLIQPTPQDYGWGVILNLTDPLKAEDLSNFANGKLNFSIKTLYPGKIEVGFSSGSRGTTDNFEAWLPISPGEYGYFNNGEWQTVSVPVQKLIAAGAKGFNMYNSVDAVPDLSKVTIPFVIADRYAKTGKDQKSGINTPINVIRIFWSQ